MGTLVVLELPFSLHLYLQQDKSIIMMYVVLLAIISTSLASPQASTCPNGELIHCPHPGTAGQPARPTTRHCVPNRTCPTGQEPCFPTPPATGRAPCPPPAPFCAEIGSCTS